MDIQHNSSTQSKEVKKASENNVSNANTQSVETTGTIALFEVVPETTGTIASAGNSGSSSSGGGGGASASGGFSTLC